MRVEIGLYLGAFILDKEDHWTYVEWLTKIGSDKRPISLHIRSKLMSIYDAAIEREIGGFYSNYLSTYMHGSEVISILDD